MQLDEINDNKLKSYLAQSAKPTLVMYYSPTQKPSRAMKSTLTEITETYEGRMRFALLPEREAKDSLNRYGILTLPTCLVFDRSKLVDRFIGTLSKEKLIERLDSTLKAL